jgi:hypothetical protein
VLLLWANDRAGAKVRADRLASADRRGRAPFTCLGCGEALVPHLGKVRSPHFAHLPGSRCPLTAPETALHLDAKERLLALCADAFAGRRKVALVARCPTCRRALPLDVATVADTADGEAAVGKLRADVLLRRHGRPALAVEVKVTHAVDPAKEAALAALEVPFVEVDAGEDWEREAEGGVEVACARSGGVSRCGACDTLARADAERAKGGETAEIAELEAYRVRGLFGPVTTSRGRRAWPPDPAAFRCPECGSSVLLVGQALARHACPGREPRPVAWRSYGGETVTLSWWRNGRRPARKRPP